MPSKILSSKELLNKNLIKERKTPIVKSTPPVQSDLPGPQVEHDISDIFPLPCFVNVRENRRESNLTQSMNLGCKCPRKRARWAQSTCTDLISATLFSNVVHQSLEPKFRGWSIVDFGWFTRQITANPFFGFLNLWNPTNSGPSPTWNHHRQPELRWASWQHSQSSHSLRHLQNTKDPLCIYIYIFKHNQIGISEQLGICLTPLNLFKSQNQTLPNQPTMLDKNFGTSQLQKTVLVLQTILTSSWPGPGKVSESYEPGGDIKTIKGIWKNGPTPNGKLGF